jgi:hypothetical protein
MKVLTKDTDQIPVNTWHELQPVYSSCLVTLAARKDKRCCGACEAVRFLW